MTKDLSPLKIARRQKVLDVAEHLFIGLGYRGTTMTAVAERVGMSKVTVYNYFADKDVLFEAVARGIADRLRAVVIQALESNASLPGAIADALIQKHAMVFDLVRSSDFSSELFAAKSLIAVTTFAKMDEDILSALGNKIGDPDLARIVFNSASGIANGAADKLQMSQDIKRLIEAIVRAC